MKKCINESSRQTTIAFIKMKATITVLVSFYVLLDSFKSVHSKNTVETKWIEQKLDHFNDTNVKTWKMRYMVTEKYFKEGGPMFFYLGGEDAILPGYIEWGLLSDLAKEHKGILFYTEHRFYGESKPTSDLSKGNLKYLNAKQALADLAHFIRTQRETDTRLAKSKVILSGCSYAGSLAVWFNRLYPELVDGTWATSAPILAKVDFKEYSEIAGKALQELGSHQCYNRIKNGIAELEKMFASDRAKEAKDLLQLCPQFDYDNKLDLATLFRAIASLFTNLVTFQKLEKEHVPICCDFLMKQKDDVTAVAAYFKEKYKSLDNKCKDLSYYATIYFLNITSYSDIVKRPFVYQMCNEFGWFQGSSSKKQPFGTKHPVTMDMQQCYDVFGTEYTREHIHSLISETNKLFGGMNPQVKNIYMTHGGLDPWSALGHGESQGASVVPFYSHCANLESVNNKDSPEMRASKTRLFELVSKWLA